MLKPLPLDSDARHQDSAIAPGWQKRRFTYLVPGLIEGTTAGKKSEKALVHKLLVRWDKMSEEQQSFLLSTSPSSEPTTYLGLKAIRENIGFLQRTGIVSEGGFDLKSMLLSAEYFANQHVNLEHYEYVKHLNRNDWSAVRAKIDDLHSKYSILTSAEGHGRVTTESLSEFVEGSFLRSTTDLAYWDALILSLDAARAGDALLAAEVALSKLWDVTKTAWRKRAEGSGAAGDPDLRVPTFVVIDEAHNFAPEKSGDVIRNRVTDRLLQIASEGRKYGIYLILATQRPTKLHRELVPECENACVLRLQSLIEAKFAVEVLGLDEAHQSQVRGLGLGQGILFGRWTTGNQLNTTIGLARTVVGGGGLGKHWQSLPNVTPPVLQSAKTDVTSAQSEFIFEFLSRTKTRIVLASLAATLKAKFPGVDQNSWSGFGTFKQYLLSLSVPSIQVSGPPPGYAQLSRTDDYEQIDPINATSFSVQVEQSFDILRENHLQIPKLSEEDYRDLFLTIEGESERYDGNFGAFRQRIKELVADKKIGVNAVTFVLRGIRNGGHNFMPTTKCVAVNLAQSFVKGVTDYVEQNNVPIADANLPALFSHISGGLIQKDQKLTK
jgi:hypothetical protein